MPGKYLAGVNIHENITQYNIAEIFFSVSGNDLSYPSLFQQEGDQLI